MNGAKKAVKTYDYDAWGNVTAQTGSLKNTNTFTARETEEDIGLMYYRARFYDPKVGRFISQDPYSGGPDDARVGYENDWFSAVHGEITLYTAFRQPHRFNRYIYCNDNPINFIDPLGLIPVDTIWDVLNIAYDIITGDTTSLAADTVALFIPYVPAGVTKIVKGAKALDRAHDAKKYSRFMSKAEAKAVEKTGMLRGGNPGDTCFTTNKYRTVKSAKDKLDLPVAPEVRVDFKIKNNPKIKGPEIEKGGLYGGKGGGVRYRTKEQVQVDIFRQRELK